MFSFTKMCKKSSRKPIEYNHHFNKEKDVIQFGKHKGISIKEAIQTYPHYIDFLERKKIIVLSKRLFDRLNYVIGINAIFIGYINGRLKNLNYGLFDYDDEDDFFDHGDH